jgi:hypothetical protein
VRVVGNVSAEGDALRARGEAEIRRNGLSVRLADGETLRLLQGPESAPAAQEAAASLPAPAAGGLGQSAFPVPNTPPAEDPQR